MSGELGQELNRMFDEDNDLFWKVAHGAWKELVRRVADEKQAKLLENTHVVRIATECAEIALKFKKADEGPQQKSTSILDVVNTPGLSPQRKQEILLSAKQKLLGDLALLDELLAPQLEAAK